MLADEDKSRGDADSPCDSVVISKSKFKILFCDMDGIHIFKHLIEVIFWYMKYLVYIKYYSNIIIKKSIKTNQNSKFLFLQCMTKLQILNQIPLMKF
jgi:hypothetical protein